ncbi:MAG TPA: DUF3810 family protein [Verrucomicrobiae bacterium]|nr:DUF3810 family protein [Verrucomicrobiae bacterium]
MLRTIAGRAFLIGLGLFVFLWQPSAAWIERAYVNGVYSQWQHVAFSITNPLPWSLGDVAVLAGLAAIVWRVAAFVRLGRARRTLAALGLAVLDLAAILAVYSLWFELSWGWNYARAPIESRVVFVPENVNRREADLTRARAMFEMNKLAAVAHAHDGEPLDVDLLRRTWVPAVQRVGDTWVPLSGEPKPTIFNPFMQATGTSGFVNPLTLTVQLASDVLWFERPFDLSHEWSHTAGYAREDEANYLAILTCIRSTDPVVEYSGWFELFLYLPPKAKYAKRDFSPLVWADFKAMRERDKHHINAMLAQWSWRTYNAYLKSNRIASGVYNYNEVARLVLGVPLDAQGLPIAK